MASPTASLCHLRMQVRFAASPFPSYSSIPSHLSPSTCHNGAFVCISLSAGTHRGASLFSRHYRLHTEKKLKSRRSVVVASLFGVGAPEALVIGVVALLVFGPKGLAEVARNLGKTLRTFQPTIRELQDVSREFKSTLEREIGLDDINPSSSTNYNSATSAKTNQPPVPDPNGKSAYSSDDLLKVTEEQLSANTPVEESQVATSSVSAESADTTIENQSSEATQVEATPIPTESKPSEKTIEQR